MFNDVKISLMIGLTVHAYDPDTWKEAEAGKWSRVQL